MTAMLPSAPTPVDPPTSPFHIYPGETAGPHVRLHVVSLGLCGLAAAGCGATTVLPWFGLPTPGGPPDPRFSALSGALATPPFGSANLAPATEKWGYLLVAWSALVAGMDVVAIITFVRNRKREGRRVTALLICVAAAAFVLIALVIAEFTAKIPWGDGPPISWDMGALFGLLLAVLSAFSASSAWATEKYPWLVGP